MKLRLTLMVLLLTLSLQACGNEPPSSADSAISPLENPVEEPAAETGSGQLTSADIVATQRAGMPTPPRLFSLVNLSNGAEIVAEMPVGNGLPRASFLVEENLDDPGFLTLEADGMEVYRWQVNDPAEITHTVTWTPWHGEGNYTLIISLFKRTGEMTAQEEVSVKVTGIPEEALAVSERIQAAYRDAFGLAITAPAFLHNHAEFPMEIEYDSWVSAAYLAGKYYAIRLYDSGRVESFSRSLAAAPGAGVGDCPPKGIYRILVAIVDYGNTGYSVERVMQNLKGRAFEANEHWAAISAAAGMPEPVMQVEADFVTIGSPPSPGAMLEPEDVLAITGVNPADYDLLAEVDIDADNSSSPSPGAGGIAFPGTCGLNPYTGVNMIVWVSNDTNYQWAGGSLFEHEFMHLLGWQHEWPTGAGGTDERFNNGLQLPYLLYGWTDTDGDGTAEINDPTPYGIGAS